MQEKWKLMHIDDYLLLIHIMDPKYAVLFGIQCVIDWLR